ncbi:MAG: hypothetical protein B7Y39_17800 [Bdellovibrio sp. 28-41-41]|nr:MAG: hypothetical protein B7Y39_17800 [Bdellovibrio sp. 28-41-41]
MRTFAKRIGVAKAESLIDVEILEDCVKDDLDRIAYRAMVVLDPIKVTITNYPADKTEEMSVSNHPKNEAYGKRTLYFSNEVYIDRKDFMETPSADFFRMAPGQQVRLRNAYVIRCDGVVKDSSGKVVELKCSYDVVTLHGKPTAEGKKIKGIIHWVSAKHSIDAEVRLYGRLFKVPDPENVPDGQDFKINLNPNSLTVLKTAKLEHSLKDADVQKKYQFERTGYFCLDSVDSKPGALVFNRIVELS